MEEEWRNIEGYPDYQVSNCGNFKSFKYDKNGQVIKQSKTKSGYLQIHLCDSNNNAKSLRSHRIIAEVFIPNPLNLPIVNHLDGNKQNNSVSNLEWCSPKSNAIHYVTGKFLEKEKIIRNYSYKITNNSLVPLPNSKINEIFNIAWKNEISAYFNETWGELEGFEGLYLISDYGRIISLCRNMLLKPTTDRDGYLKIVLTDKNRKVHYFRVHQVVALTFIPKKLNFTHINHKDGNKQNNKVDNLEWCSVTYNNRYRHILNPSLFQNEDSNYATKLNKEKVLEIYNILLNREMTYLEIAEKYNISAGTVIRILQKKIWSVVTKDLKDIKRLTFKLTRKEILEIYDLAWNSDKTLREIAEEYDIHEEVASRIKIGKMHSKITSHKYQRSPQYINKLNEKEALEIYDLVWSGVEQKNIAEKYNVSMGIVGHIKNGRAWNHVTHHLESEKIKIKDFSNNEILDIFNLAQNENVKQQEIIDKYNINKKVLHNIKYGIKFKEITHYTKIPKKKKFSDIEILNIFNLAWDKNTKQQEIIDKYDISEKHLHAIKHGKIYKKITHYSDELEKKKLSNVEILDIYNLAWDKNVPTNEITNKYNLHRNTLYSIKNGRIFSEITYHTEEVRQKIKYELNLEKELEQGKYRFPATIYPCDILKIHNMVWINEIDLYYQEEWIDVKGYEGLYSVSNKGNILGLKRKKLLTPVISKDGFYVVSLSKNNIRKQFSVHYLVASNHIPNISNMKIIIHRDGNNLNNYKENLEWSNTAYHSQFENPNEELNLDSEEWKDIKGYEGRQCA